MQRYSARDAAVLEANRLAAMLSDAPADGADPLSPPAFIADPRLAPAAQVWRDLAPDLARLGCLKRTDRIAFAALCIAITEYVAAHEDVLVTGYTVPTPTMHGGVMMRVNPSVRRRDTALATIVEFSTRFGMTPLDRFRLITLKTRAPDLDTPEMDLPASPAPTDVADARPSRWDQLLGPRVAKPN